MGGLLQSRRVPVAAHAIRYAAARPTDVEVAAQGIEPLKRKIG